MSSVLSDSSIIESAQAETRDRNSTASLSVPEAERSPPTTSLEHEHAPEHEQTPENDPGSDPAPASDPHSVFPVTDWICPDGRRVWSVTRNNISIPDTRDAQFKEGLYHLVIIWLSHVRETVQYSIDCVILHSCTLYPALFDVSIHPHGSVLPPTIHSPPHSVAPWPP